MLEKYSKFTGFEGSVDDIWLPVGGNEETPRLVVFVESGEYVTERLI